MRPGTGSAADFCWPCGTTQTCRRAGPAYLSICAASPGGGVDYAQTWSEIRAAAFPAVRSLVTDRISFENVLRKALRQRPGRYVFYLLGPGRGFEEDYWDALALFHMFALGVGTPSAPVLVQIAAIDDFSLYYYRRGSERIYSTFYKFQHEIASALSLKELRECFEYLFGEKYSDQEAAEFSQRAFDLTGGHLGLTLQLLDDIASYHSSLDDSFFLLAGERLAASDVLERIRTDIQEDPVGIAKTAVEFRTSSYVVEGRSPRYHFLRQIGVLRWESESKAALCPGLITNLFESLANATQSTRIGTMVQPSGGLYFEEAGISICDDDLVCVHISDLHVGPHYAFRLQYEGGLYNPNAAFLGDLLRDDIERLGLTGKINGLIMSGDVVSTGDISEFKRARDVLKQISDAFQISSDQLIIVPGNHDVTWDPGSMAAKSELGATVSRENFDIFLELMGLGQFGSFQIKKIISRNGKRALRLIGVDSNFVESRAAAGIGFVEHDALHKIGLELSHTDQEATQEILNWLIVHHHVLPVTSSGVEDARAKRVSVMGNAAEILNYAANWNVELILHGHEHQPGLTIANRWTSDFRDLSLRPIAVAAAGSCGARRDLLGPISRNHYQIIIRQGDTLNILSRVLGEGALHFVSYVDFRIPLFSGRETPKERAGPRTKDSPR